MGQKAAFGDYIFKCSLSDENCCILIWIRWKFELTIGISSGNGVSPNTWRGIILANNDTVYQHIYASQLLHILKALVFCFNFTIWLNYKMMISNLLLVHNFWLLLSFILMMITVYWNQSVLCESILILHHCMWILCNLMFIVCLLSACSALCLLKLIDSKPVLLGGLPLLF